MWFTSWLRNGNHSASTARRPTPTSPRQRASFRPQLEALEDRCVPSTLTVTNLNYSGHGSLREEIAAAQSGDTIVFSPKKVPAGSTINTFYTNKDDIKVGLELYINKNLTIEGPSGGVWLNAGGLSRVLEVAAGVQVQLSGLNFENGGNQLYQPAINLQFGGGILNHGVLTVTDCQFLSDTAEFGGGIYNDGTLTVTGSFFQGNLAGVENDGFGADGYGGGIYNASTATVSGCTIFENTAITLGGGIFNAGTAGALTVSDSIFSGNSNSGGGGGIGNFPDNISGGYTDGGGNTFS